MKNKIIGKSPLQAILDRIKKEKRKCEHSWVYVENTELDYSYFECELCKRKTKTNNQQPPTKNQ